MDYKRLRPEPRSVERRGGPTSNRAQQLWTSCIIAFVFVLLIGRSTWDWEFPSPTSLASPLHHDFPPPPTTTPTAAASDIRISTVVSPPPSTPVEHQTRFALRLAAAISSPFGPGGAAKNAAFSPLSIHVVLSLLAAGAGGATRDQLAAVLAGGSDQPVGLHALAEQMVHLVLADGSGAGGPRLAVGDGVFVDASAKLDPAFEELAVGKYNAEIRSVDFQHKAPEVVGEINSWVENITSSLIKNLLSKGSVDSTTKLVLVNALYFKGAWIKKFDPSKTKDGEFHLLNGGTVQTPFMSSTDDQYIECYNDLKVLKLPYQQGGDKQRRFSMYILLPEARDGMRSLVKNLTSEPGFLLENHIPKRKVKVGQLKIPKFKISYGFEASKLLKGLGLQLAFSSQADLSGLVDSENLQVSSVFHKSFVEVNEEGSEAAAATALLHGRARMVEIPRLMDFIADHPFLFLIREESTGVVLFIGHVVNPLLV